MIEFTDDYRSTQFGDGGLIHRGTITDVFSEEAEAIIMGQGKARKAAATAKEKVGGEPSLSRKAQMDLAEGDKRKATAERKAFDKKAEKTLSAVKATEEEAKEAAKPKKKTAAKKS